MVRAVNRMIGPRRFVANPLITRNLSLFMAACLVGMGCSGSGGGLSGNTVALPNSPSTPAQNVPPISLSYGVPRSLELGVLVSLVPNVTGVTAYSVSPSLPAGLSLDAHFGYISGTPTSLSPATSYVITASGNAGSTTVSVMLEVIADAVFYSSPVVASLNSPIPPVVPRSIGTITQFSVTPDLPSGLSIDPTTGVISGTPTQVSNFVSYQITGVGQLSPIEFDLLLGVMDTAGGAATGYFRDSTVAGLGYRSGSHSGVTDAQGRYTYEIGQNITFTVGAITLGAAPAKSQMTPVDLITNGNGKSTYVINVVRFLLMLDQDGDPSNGIQIAPDMTTAAAQWAPVDFNTTDLPTALATIISQAQMVEGDPHYLPDAATAQAQLTKNYYCAYSGGFLGTYQNSSGDGSHGLIAIAFTPDGRGNARVLDFSNNEDIRSNGLDGLSLLDGTFALNFDTPDNTNLRGSFSGTDVITGTYSQGSLSSEFTAARIGGSPNAHARFTGGFAARNNSYPAGFSVMDVDTAFNLTGYQYQFGKITTLSSNGSDPAVDFNKVTPFNGSISGSSANIAIAGQSLLGSYFSENLLLRDGDPYDTDPSAFDQGSIYLVMDGCLLN
jgi:Putative Ig domain